MLLNDNFTQRHILLFANYITLIVFVFCAVFNNLQHYILAEKNIEKVVLSQIKNNDLNATRCM